MRNPYRSLEVTRDLISDHAKESRKQTEPLGVNCHSYALSVGFRTLNVPWFKDQSEADLLALGIENTLLDFLDHYGVFVTPQKEPLPDWITRSPFVPKQPPPSKFIDRTHADMLNRVSKHIKKDILTTYHVVQNDHPAHSGVIAPKHLQVHPLDHLYDFSVLERPNSVWYTQHNTKASWDVTYQQLRQSIDLYKRHNQSMELWFVPWTKKVIQHWAEILRTAQQDTSNEDLR